MMPSLLTLPLELLVVVSTHLSTKDLGFLRLTCKQVEQSLYSWFAEEFFTKKQFMLTHKSLQTLVDISRHESLSKQVTHVILATNIYIAVRPVRPVPYTFRDADAATSWAQGFYDQQSLMSTGYDRDMLTDAFEKLENLQVVGIRDFNSNNRHRDGTSWSSWGAPTILRETGFELPFASSQDTNMATSFLTHIFQTLICALARAGRNPREIEVLLRKEPLPDIAFHFPAFLTPSVTPVLQNLETLLISTGRVPTHGLNHSIIDGPFLRQFLRQTYNIRHLRINFNKHDPEHTKAFLEWLGQPAVGAGAAPIRILDPPPIVLTHLKQLELGQMTIRPIYMLRVIEKFASTLKDFCLWRTNLVSHPDDGIARPAAKSTMTADFLKSLAHMPQLCLTNFKLGFLQQDGYFTNFKTRDLKDAPYDKIREYTGENMGHFIRGLINDIVIQQPGRSYSGDSDDGSNDDDNEDSDMLDEDEGDSENDEFDQDNDDE
jgi:hypothetical protein